MGIDWMQLKVLEVCQNLIVYNWFSGNFHKQSEEWAGPEVLGQDQGHQCDANELKIETERKEGNARGIEAEKKREGVTEGGETRGVHGPVEVDTVIDLEDRGEWFLAQISVVY